MCRAGCTNGGGFPIAPALFLIPTASHHCRFRTINVLIVAFLARRRRLLWRERTAED
jgi:hypothetical protein